MCVIVMGVQLAVFILLSFRFLKKGEEEYEYEIEDISDKDFPFKKYIPLGIYFSEIFDIKSKLPFSFREPILEYQNSKRLLSRRALWCKVYRLLLLGL